MEDVEERAKCVSDEEGDERNDEQSEWLVLREERVRDGSEAVEVEDEGRRKRRKFHCAKQTKKKKKKKKRNESDR